MNPHIINLIEQLERKGYLESLIYKNDAIVNRSRTVILNEESAFFVDIAFHSSGEYIFAISAPAHKLKGTLMVDKETFDKLTSNKYRTIFFVPVKDLEKDISDFTIRRQYGMRKILSDEFDAERYELRSGFSDFPTCPFNNHYASLGYDKKEKEYVRLASSILKKKNLKRKKYNS